MNDVYSYREGESPLLVSVPHDGRLVPDGQRERMTAKSLSLPDTDWHVARLYDFATDLGASLIVANYSRYVVDLNRPSDNAALYDGQHATGLCPRYSFSGQPLYVDDRPVASEDVEGRIATYWRPYHDKLAASLAELKARHGYALLWDAHSIASRVPRLFDGELPVLNIGTWDERSCGTCVSAALLDVAESSPYTAVLNGRFKGGYITRHYGSPENDVHAVQLEIAQRAYMNEESGAYSPVEARRLQDTLRALLGTFSEALAVQ